MPTIDAHGLPFYAVVVLYAVAVGLGVAGSAFLWHGLCSIPQQRYLLKLYQIQGIDISGRVMSETVEERSDHDRHNKYIVKYKYIEPFTLLKKTCARECRSHEPILHKSSSTVHIKVLPDFPRSGIPETYIDPQLKLLSIWVQLVYCLLGLEVFGVWLYIFTIVLEITDRFLLLLVAAALFLSGRPITCGLMRVWRKQLLEEFLDAPIMPTRSYGSVGTASSASLVLDTILE